MPYFNVSATINYPGGDYCEDSTADPLTIDNANLWIKRTVNMYKDATSFMFTLVPIDRAQRSV